MKIGSIGLVVLSVLGFIFAKPLVAVFRDDPMVIEIGYVALRAQCVVFGLNVYVIMSTMLLQTIGKAVPASIVAMARQGLFFVPMILLLPLLSGLFGVQIAQPAADVLSFFLAIPLCRKVLKEMV